MALNSLAVIESRTRRSQSRLRSSLDEGLRDARAAASSLAKTGQSSLVFERKDGVVDAEGKTGREESLERSGKGVCDKITKRVSLALGRRPHREAQLGRSYLRLQLLTCSTAKRINISK